MKHTFSITPPAVIMPWSSLVDSVFMAKQTGIPMYFSPSECICSIKDCIGLSYVCMKVCDETQV